MQKKSVLLAVLGILITAAVLGAFSQTGEDLFQKALRLERNEGKLMEAIALYQKVVAEKGSENLAAQAQLRIGMCYEKLGSNKIKLAQAAFQKVVDNYPMRPEEVKIAREKLAILLQAQTIAQKEAQELRIQLVWSERSTDIDGEISPDGKYLCFTDWNTGDLAVRDLTTGKNRRLTKKGSWLKSEEFALFSKWSPDGKQVFYNWYNPKGDKFDIYSVSIEGTKPKVLYQTNDFEYVQPFDWHPNGNQVLIGFYKGGDTFVVGYLSVVDGNLKILKTFKRNYGQDTPWGFVISPDGNTIAYDDRLEHDSNNRDIFLLSADGTEQRLVDHPSLDYVFNWTSDGKYLLFGSERTGNRGAWMVEVKNGKAIGSPSLIKSGIGPAFPLGCTRQNQFYYAYNNNISDIYVTEFDPTSGKVLTAPKREVRYYEGHNYLPDYSSDGKYLAYISLRNTFPKGEKTICIYSLENGDIQELYPEFGKLSYPQWHPDGKSISLEGTDGEGRQGIYLMEIDSERVTPIVQIKEDEEIYSHRWSVDGKTLFYTKGIPREKTSRIRVHDMSTGQDQELPGSPNDANDIAVSPDGKFLVLLNRNIIRGKRSLRIIPTGGGEPQELYSFETVGNFVITPAWSPDGKYIYLPLPAGSADNFELKKSGSTDVWDMWRISLEGGEGQKLDMKMARFLHLSVHPDGRHIAFSSFGRALKYPEVWVMENFLPKRNTKK
jgi:Tol biopolymer transport system component